ncbi:MAG: helix-turn-helix domain-containing protein [Candidatus Poseidoniaceae archaeon]|nr:helix-turn-helix domain-containing protein [Candidatus Poseidoniaceae archaeon]
MSEIIKIEIRLPNGHWAGDSSRRCPSSNLQIVETMPLSKGRGTAQITTDSNLLEVLRTLPEIESINILNDQKATVNIVSGGGGFIRPLRVVGLVPRTPFDVVDGWVSWTIQCTPELRKKFIEELKKADLPYRIKSTRITGKSLLTSRQLEVFQIARNKGYWSTPRQISLVELSKLLDISKSTLSVLLHSIEGKIIEEYYEEIRQG